MTLRIFDGSFDERTAALVARWRGEGGLTEIRAADLRFTPEESATYLDGTIGGVLTTQDVAMLDQRTLRY